MRATRAEVAKLAGVSPSVVSYVLNGGPRNVAPATRRRVEEAIASLEYRPNAIAQALRGGRSGAIGVIVGHGQDDLFRALSFALQHAAQSFGYAMYVSFARGAATERQYARSLVDRQVDGLIAIKLEDPSILAALREDGLPVAMVSNTEPTPGILTLHADPSEPTMALFEAISIHHPTVVLHSVALSSMVSASRISTIVGTESLVFRVDTIAGGSDLAHMLQVHRHAVVMCATDTELERVLWLAGSIGIDVRNHVFTTSRIDYHQSEIDKADIAVRWRLKQPMQQIFAELIRMIDDPETETFRFDLPWQIVSSSPRIDRTSRIWDVADI